MNPSYLKYLSIDLSTILNINDGVTMKVQLNDIRHPETYEGKEPKHHSPSFDYCRKLIAEGVDPKEPLEVYRGEMLAYTVSSIGWGAKKKIYENDKRGPYVTNYKENPFKIARRANAGAA